MRAVWLALAAATLMPSVYTEAETPLTFFFGSRTVSLQSRTNCGLFGGGRTPKVGQTTRIPRGCISGPGAGGSDIAMPVQLTPENVENLRTLVELRMDKLLSALSIPGIHKSEYFRRRLLEHCQCAEFRVEPVQGNNVGFSCACRGPRKTLYLELRTVREEMDSARRMLARIRTGALPLPAGNKQRKRDRHRAEKRSYALLCRYLTREQRLELRYTKGFHTRGQDGALYHLGLGRLHSIERIGENGDPTHRYCIVAKDRDIPVWDQVLTQKLLLEGDLKAFESAANSTRVRDLDHGDEVQHIPFVDPMFTEVFRLAIRDSLDNTLDKKPRLRFPLSDQGVGAPEALVRDIPMLYYKPEAGKSVALYETAHRGRVILGYVLAEDSLVYPCFLDGGTLIHIPRLPNTVNTAESIARLVTGAPASVYRTFDDVYLHYHLLGLSPTTGLVHPDTAVEDFSHGGRRHLIVFYEHELIPPGKVFFLPAADHAGIVTHWEDHSGKGFGLVNPQAVAVLDLQPEAAT